MRSKNKPISYSTTRDDVLKVLKSIGLDSKVYGLHSLRSGGASAFGVKDRLIMKHGRWKSEGVKNRYISEDISSLLFVSQNLNL